MSVDVATVLKLIDGVLQSFLLSLLGLSVCLIVAQEATSFANY